MTCHKHLCHRDGSDALSLHLVDLSFLYKSVKVYRPKFNIFRCFVYINAY